MTENVTSGVANLLSMPEEVMYSCIFPLLRQNDLLRLRRTCRQIKKFAEGYFRVHWGREQEKEINETDFTFDDFIRVNFPGCRIYLNNTGPKFFEHPRIPKFLQLYAETITYLRVKHFSMCISEQENNFFLALTNLQHLELELTDACGWKFDYTWTTVNKVKVPREMCYFPVTFKNLKTLKLGEILGLDQMDHMYGRYFIEYCTDVEYLRHPRYKSMIHGTCTIEEEPFNLVMQLVEKKLKEEPKEPVKLKFYDILYIEGHPSMCGDYYKLLNLCNSNNIKLLNVHQPLQFMVHCEFVNKCKEYADPVVSVKGVHGSIFLTDFENLEEMVITSTGSSQFYWQTYVDWPNLKMLDLNIDSEKTWDNFEFPAERTKRMNDLLFGIVHRDELKDLRIRFDTTSQYGPGTLPCPNVDDVRMTCKWVTKLTLVNWQGSNRALCKLWTGLRLLEEIILDECKTLSIVAFSGTNQRGPIFLQLKKLKKLTLSGLEVMPRLNDRVFETIFCHLRIKHFYLRSKTPIKSFTITGIRSLLTGEFNNSVEKFPFSGWSLENVSEEEFCQLKSDFRASYML